MRASLIVLALAAAVAGAGCGGSGPSSSSHQAQATATSPATRTSAGAPAPPPTTTVTATATSTVSVPATRTRTSASGGSGGAGLAGAARCRAAGLALGYLGGRGATGHGELGFALRNTTRRSCRTGGYPGIQFLDRSRRPLPTRPRHTTSDFFGTLRLAELTVAPGHSISFRLGVSHGAASPAGCATAYGLQVIPPNDTATLRVVIPNGAVECRTATVSPVQPGHRAFR